MDVGPDGHLEMAGGRVSADGGQVTLLGRISGDGVVDAYLYAVSSGEVEVQQGYTLEFTSPSPSLNYGDIFLGGGTLRIASALYNEANGNILGRGTLVAACLQNAGDVALSNGVTDVRGDVLNNAGGRIFISGQADVTFWDDVHNDGDLFRCSEGCSATFFGSLSGSGSITGTGQVYIEGDLTPGTSPAAIGFGGDVSFGPLAQLNVELGGTAAGSGYDQVNVAGSATLSGTLAVSLIDAFAPDPGDAFTVLTYGSRSGDFAAITGWDDDELAHLAFYNANDLTLHCTWFGDATLEGCVDGADYTAWADHYHQSAGWGDGDFTGDGWVDGADYTAWADNYGQGCGSGGTLPEPAALVLLALGAVGLIRRRRWS